MALPAAAATILVVEDDPALRAFDVTALRAAGFRVVAAEDGLEALRWIDQQTPALIILDLGLIRVSGSDVRSELRAHARTRSVPILVVTGSDTRGLDSDALTCVLRKPVTADALVSAAQKCLQMINASR